MTRLLILVMAASAVLAGHAQSPAPIVSARDAKKFAGKDATMCGRVVAYSCSSARDTILLHLDKPYWESGSSLAIGVGQRSAIGERLEDQYLWRDVCGTGRVERVDGQYVVRVGAPGALQPPPGAGASAVAFAPDAVQACTAGVTLPRLVREVQPKYTADAIGRLLQGRVLVDAVVNPDGTVGDVRIVYSLDKAYGLDKNALEAVRQWRFVSGTVHGTAVPMIVQIELRFRLK